MKCSELRRLVTGVLEEKTPEPSESDSAPQASAQDAPTDRELAAMETAIRTLIPLARLYDQAGTDLFDLNLTWESELPLPPVFIPAAVYLTGYLLGGNSRLINLYADEYKAIQAQIPADLTVMGRP